MSLLYLSEAGLCVSGRWLATCPLCDTSRILTAYWWKGVCPKENGKLGKGGSTALLWFSSNKHEARHLPRTAEWCLAEKGRLLGKRNTPKFVRYDVTSSLLPLLLIYNFTDLSLFSYFSDNSWRLAKKQEIKRKRTWLQAHLQTSC